MIRLAKLGHRAGFVVAIAAFLYLSLSSYGKVPPGDAVVYWNYTDKRPLIYGYLVVLLLIAFHWAMTSLFIAPPRATGVAAPREASGGIGLVAVVLLAFWWLCLPVLASVDVQSGNGLAPFYQAHAHVHLGAFEQIRQGAVPYVEAKTQYGLGNLVLTYWLTKSISFSSHGFHAANMLLNAVCIVGFFAVVQRAIGTGLAIAGIVAWIAWPSPYEVSTLAGWAILSRWLAIPILSLLLASQLLGSERRPWWAPVLAGTIWGVGGFLAQESFSGGILVLALSLALFGPPSGRRLLDLVQFAVSFVVAGLCIYVALVVVTLGPGHAGTFLLERDTKAALVVAGLSNAWWAEGLDTIGNWMEFLQTYGSAAMLPAILALLAIVLHRQWAALNTGDRIFIRRFAGIAVGACVMHLFTLLRSDSTHLAGPSFLLPLLVVMFPVFAWRFVQGSLLRYALTGVALAALVVPLVASSGTLLKKVIGVDTLWTSSSAALRVYGELARGNNDSMDIADRYSPIPRVQAAFRTHGDFVSTVEMFAALRERLHGRRVELGTYELNSLLHYYPELFYFYGQFRSISGVTSQTTSIWLLSERNAWIDAVLATPGACVFFGPDATTPMAEAWRARATGAVDQPIEGRKKYGILSCKP